MDYSRLGLSINEALLYINHDAYFNGKSGDLFFTNKNIIFGSNVNISFFKTEYQVIKIGLNDILILNNRYKIWLSNDDEDEYKFYFLTNNSSYEYSVSFGDGDEETVKDCMIILINIMNFIYH